MAEEGMLSLRSCSAAKKRNVVKIERSRCVGHLSRVLLATEGLKL